MSESPAHPPVVSARPSPRTVVALVAIVLVAATLRFVGQGWGLVERDSDVYQVPAHPDETTLTLAALSQMDLGRRDFNPEIGHMDGTFFYYVLAATEVAASKLGLVHIAGTDYYHEHPKALSRFMRIARTLPALFGIATVLVLFAFARRAAGDAAGLAAAAVVAVAPISVLSGHFARPHALIDFFLSCVLGAAYVYRSTGERRWLFTAAVAVGLLASTRYPMVLVSVVLAVAEFTRASRPSLRASIGALARAAAIVLTVWIVTCPYLVLDPASVLEGMRRTSGWSAPPDWSRLGMEIELRTLHVGDAALTLPLYLAALASTVVVLLRRRDVAVIVFPWLAIYGSMLFLSPFARDAARWMQPLLPVLATAFGVVFADLLRSTSSPARRIGLVVACVALFVPAVGRSIAFADLLRGRDPRLEARAYVETHIPHGTPIGIGRTPDILALGMRTRAGYPIVTTNRLYQELPPVPAERDVPLLLTEAPEWFMVADTQFQRLPRVGYRRSMSEEKYQLLFGPDSPYEVVKVFAPARRVPWLPMGREARVIEECVVAPTVYLLRRRSSPS